MSEILREQAQWRKGKTPLVGKYLTEHRKVFDAIAGRGFLNLPGFAYDMENGLEMALKQNLSELNYKILAETIEREMKQAGIDYDTAYATAALAWESEKQSLMAAWDAELSGIKQGMAQEEEVKSRLSLEVDARQAVLIAAKTSIETQMESYRAQLAALDDDTADYEVSLANAKLLTAQKKLELIPIMQEILTKEGELLDLGESKTAYYKTFLDAEQEVATKKNQLIPSLSQLATKIQQHADAILGQVTTEQAIAAEKIAQAEAKVEVADNEVDRLTLDIATENKRVDIDEARRDLTDKQFKKTTALTSLEINNETEYQNNLNDAFTTLNDDARNTSASLINLGRQTNDVRNDDSYQSVVTLNDADKDAHAAIAAAKRYETREIASLTAAKAITASLTHLIG